MLEVRFPRCSGRRLSQRHFLLGLESPNWGAALSDLGGPGYSLIFELPLAGTPEAASIQARVDGARASGFTHDQATNSILFDEGTAPPPGVVVEVSYEGGC